MLAAGLLAKKAVERGLSVKPWVKTSLAPGSRVVSEYLKQDGAAAVPRPIGLQPRRVRLHDLHRQFGAARSWARRGAHEERPHRRERAVGEPQLRGAHSPEREGELPHEPAAGRGVCHCRPDRHRSHARAARDRRRARGLPARRVAVDAGDRCAPRERVRSRGVPARLCRLRPPEPAVEPDPRRDGARSTNGTRRRSTSASRRTSILRWRSPRPPRSPVRGRSPSSAIRSRRTTSARPARSSRPHRPAATCAIGACPVQDFNSYGARRGNHEVMVRGTFANVRIRNLMVPGRRGRHHSAPARRRAHGHLRRGRALPRRGRAADRDRRTGLRSGQLARLGGQGHAPARRARGDRSADSSGSTGPI